MIKLALLALLILSQILVPVRAELVALQNPGFEDFPTRPVGWRTTQHAGEIAYEFEIDSEDAASGEQSFRMTCTVQQVYGLIDQKVAIGPAEQPRKMHLSAKMKSKDIGPRGWMLVVNFLGPRNAIISQVRSQHVSGTNDWKTVVLDKPIPDRTEALSVGVMLLDFGIGWVDDVQLDVSTKAADPATDAATGIR
ncbi:MAG: hypothetical protein KDH88_19285 [Chromatiales bacterium]|nr:hypothetical protein [Chromatiales bacterium]